MIKQSVHEKLEKKWMKVGPAVYQRWNRLATRMPLFLKYVKHLKGLNVVEFGCNDHLCIQDNNFHREVKPVVVKKVQKVFEIQNQMNLLTRVLESQLLIIVRSLQLLNILFKGKGLMPNLHKGNWQLDVVLLQVRADEHFPVVLV